MEVLRKIEPASQHVTLTSPSMKVGSRQHLFPPSLILIGASTGGPQALVALISDMTDVLPYISVCVTLHMPPDLVPVIAAHVTRKCGATTRVVTDRTVLEKSVVHFAPGDRHLEFAKNRTGIDIVPTAKKTRDFCKPAIDTMFTSGATVMGSRTLGIVLSGMGTDGLAGARSISTAGGIVLAQDKGSSAVWGMPGAVAKANLSAATLPPGELAREVARRVSMKGTRS